MRRSGWAAVAVALLVVVPTGPASSGDACDWPMYGRDAGHSFAAPDGCTQIGPLNVASLRPAWFVRTDSPVTASPSVVDGVVYVGDGGGTFYAIRADDGTVLWTFRVDDTNEVSYGRIVSSAAVDEVAGRRVVAFGGGSTLYVLDAADGALLARSCFDPRSESRCAGSSRTIEIESSPVFVHDDGRVLVMAGMDFNEAANVGRAGLVQLELVTEPSPDGEAWTLRPVWKFDPETQRTYTGDGALTAGGPGSGCGNVWSSPAVDADARLVFFGTGNCSDGTLTPASAYGEAVWAVDLTSGALVWRHSPRGLNGLDLDIGASPNLLPGGRVGIGGKDGTYTAYGRAPGCPVPCDPQTPDWTARVATDSDIGGLIGTAAVGAVSGEPAIFATSAVPVSTRTGIDPRTVAPDPGRVLALHAIRASDGAVLWHAPVPLPSYAAATYANGVVYLADTFGFSVQAYAADTGTPLWAFPLLAAPSSAPAVVGDSIYLGAGTAADPVPSFWQLSGIWGFRLAASL